MTRAQKSLQTRRLFLKKAALSLAAVSVANLAGRLAAATGSSAAEKDLDLYDFVLTRLKFSDVKRGLSQWNLAPEGDFLFVQNLKKHLRINVATLSHRQHNFTRVANLARRDEVLEYPFLFMTDNKRVALPPNEFKNLKEYLERGGFLFADDCVEGRSGDLFFQSFIEMIPRMFPGKKMEILPDDHPINSCYFRLGFTPFFQGKNHGSHGLYLDGRMAVFFTPGDIHCGWCQPQDQWYGKGSFRRSVQMGTNIVVFALTQQGKMKKS